MTYKDVSLLQKKASARKEQGLFVMEGERACFDILRADALSNFVDEIFVSNEFYADKRNVLASLTNKKMVVVPDHTFAKMSDTKTPQGILLVMRMPAYKETDIFKENGFVLALDNVSDPGNIGTIMRTALAAGIDGLVISDDSCDIFNPKVVRATMSAIMRIPFLIVDDIVSLIRNKQADGISIYVTTLDDTAVVYRNVSYEKSVMVVVGNEANGVRDDIISLADTKIYIPMAGGMESLNVAVASALIMYEGNT